MITNSSSLGWGSVEIEGIRGAVHEETPGMDKGSDEARA